MLSSADITGSGWEAKLMKKLRVYSTHVVHFMFYLFISTGVLAEDTRAESSTKQSGPLQFISQLFDAKHKKNPCQLSTVDLVANPALV